jgi:hypothetical protein
MGGLPEMFFTHNLRLVALLTLICVVASNPLLGQEKSETELDRLVTTAEMELLFTELGNVNPPGRLRELSKYSNHQSELGGGFYGMMPDQLVEMDSIPVSLDGSGMHEAALLLARQREVNNEALMATNPDYAVSFRSETLEDFLSRLEPAATTDSGNASGLKLELDWSAFSGFFDALADGEITIEEARSLASLPSNQAMLQHRRNLGYVPEPLPDTDSLAELISMAGSVDPLDRLWCWINSQNAFAYADLVQNSEDYLDLLSDLDKHGHQLEKAVLERIERFTPPGTRFESRFAFTVGWAIRGWATPQMAGLNLEQVKNDWHFLMGTMVEETYHRLQLQLIPMATGAQAEEFSDLTVVNTGDPSYDRFYECVTYTVAEGAANFVRGPFAAPYLPEKAIAGTEIIARFVSQVIEKGDLEAADALINEGLQGNGPLYGLGWKLASVIAEHEGPQAIGIHQQKGSVHFFIHGAELAAGQGEQLVSPDVILALKTLEEMIQP